jgi:hypothetical protein
MSSLSDSSPFTAPDSASLHVSPEATPDAPTASVLETGHLETLRESTYAELRLVRERIEVLQQQVLELAALQEKEAQLAGLETHLGMLLEGRAVCLQPSVPERGQAASSETGELRGRKRRKAYSHSETLLPEHSTGAFFPEKAYTEADDVLRHRFSMNYEIFRAIVLNGGQASTREIRQYLIDQRIKTAAGKTFEDTPLSEISARTAYLVKRQVIRPIAPGRFQSCFGWENA